MKTLGIIGGIAPGSTIDYYRLLVERYRQRRPDGRYPSMVINSLDFQRFIALVAAGDKTRLAEYLLAEVAALARAGADVALFASNTPHLVFDQVERLSPIPLISLVEATGEAAAAHGLRKVGLLGTRFTMEGGFYSSVLARHGIAVVIPDVDDRARVHDRYLGELAAGVFRDETRDVMIGAVNRMQATEGIDGVILGGTELPLLFRNHEPAGIPFLDTTSIHVDRAVALISASE